MKGRSKSRARFVSSRALLYDAGQGLYRCGRRRFSKDPSNAASASSVRGREGPRHAQQSCSAVAAAHGASQGAWSLSAGDHLTSEVGPSKEMASSSMRSRRRARGLLLCAYPERRGRANARAGTAVRRKVPATYAPGMDVGACQRTGTYRARGSYMSAGLNEGRLC